MAIELRAEKLTHEAWRPYGDLIQASSEPESMPSSIVTTIGNANPLPTLKYNRLSPITSLYPSSPSDPKAHTAVNVIRLGPPAGLRHGGVFEIRMLERHAATSQAFVPMVLSGGEAKGWEDWTGEKSWPVSEEKGKGGMIVVGCLNGLDDKPDLSTLKVFVASPSQGICYHAGIWHHSVCVFAPADYASIDTQITTDGSLKIDLEILRRPEDEGEPFARVQLPDIGA